jgi:hypothetical protein
MGEDLMASFRVQTIETIKGGTLTRVTTRYRQLHEDPEDPQKVTLEIQDGEPLITTEDVNK